MLASILPRNRRGKVEGGGKWEEGATRLPHAEGCAEGRRHEKTGMVYQRRPSSGVVPGIRTEALVTRTSAY